MKKRKIIFAVVLLFAVLFLLISVEAIGVQLICLRKGEVIKFSQCNPNIPDKICESTTCQLCVDEIRTGVYCPESLNSCNEGSGSCKYLYEQQQQQNETQEKLPVITLFNPVNGYFQEEAGEIEFSFKATDSSKLEICNLILNNKSVASKSRPISLSTQRLYYTPEPGDYIWNIECTTRTGAYSKIYAITSESREFSVEKTNETSQNETQNILLITPENGYTIEGAQNILFSYSISYANLSEIQECKLILNENAVSVSNEISAENTITQLLDVGSYTWRIECTANEILTSEIRNLTINSPALAPASSPSGGGGGGGGCLTKWNCTEWGGCINGSQTRNCNKEKKYCYAEKEPDKTRNCTLSTENLANNLEANEEIEEEKETETLSENIVQKGVKGITGAVVGVLDDNRTPIAVAFIIAVVFVVIMISYFKKK